MDQDQRVSNPITPSREFWKGRRVLMTGHTGFKGAWLTAWLSEMGASVMGLSLETLPSKPCLWALLELDGVIDLRSDIAGTAWQAGALDFDPEVVIHLAAQSLVPRGYEDPLTTFRANVLGTAQVMHMLDRFRSLLAALIVTTDKVYDVRQPTPHSERSFLGGLDPYSASKAAAELLVQSWPTGQIAATARAGNVIGGGDWAPDRLLPDLVRAWEQGEQLVLRRPDAVRPWQHVLEPLRGYLLYAERLAHGGAYARSMNFGPNIDQCVAVEHLVEHAADTWFKSEGRHPDWLEAGDPTLHETALLELDSRLAAEQLGWTNVLDWRESLEMTLDWHARWRAGELPPDLVHEQLLFYLERVEGTI